MGSGGGKREAQAAAQRHREAQEAREREEHARREREEFERRLREEREAAERARREAWEAKVREEGLRRQRELDEEARRNAQREAKEAEQRAAIAEERRRQAEKEAQLVKEAALREEFERRLKEEKEAAERAQREAEKARAREEELRKQREMNEEARRKAEREAKEAEERAAAAAERSRQAEEEAQQAKEAAENARQQREKAEAEVQKLQEAVDKGIAPEKWPSKEEYAAAFEAISYNKERVHFAVCGPSGSGKSSLINALRGILDTDNRNAAEVGVTESTRVIARYPDLRTEAPYSYLVWYDIPGAGTLNVSDWQYFVDQKLFVFDFLIMVYDARFTKIDIGILENSLRFKVPLFVVRSKADQHIENMVKIEEREEEAKRQEEQGEEEFDYEDADWEKEEKRKRQEREKRCRERFIHETREGFRKNLREIIASRPGPTHPDLLKLDVYIVSSHAMYSLFCKKRLRRPPPRIDEEKLIGDMKKVILSGSGMIGKLAALVV